jgi:hypothetical protein
MLNRRSLMLGVASAGIAGYAGVAGAADPSSLGRDLTPFGAIKAGSGDIPAWTGGITSPPAGYTAGKHVDPYASDKIVVTINASNVGQYAAKLSAGVIAKIKTYPDFHVNVYPSHRSFAAPQSVYDAVAQNARTAKLSADELDVTGMTVAIPFPLASNGSEAMFNHVLRWRGTALTRTELSITPELNGSFTPIRTTEKIYFPIAQPGQTGSDVSSLFISEVNSPALAAGEITLTHDYIDPFTKPREAWVYNPGQRRVRRAPDVIYDTPLTRSEGLATTDEYDGFNGSLDHYNWKLVGRKELYIPYNCFKLLSSSTDLATLIKPSFMNPDDMRWELHRVYVVEATLKPGAHHLYPRRTFYLDEDSWQIALTDKYDARGALWRTTETFPYMAYELPGLGVSGIEYNDLLAKRYYVLTLAARDAPNTNFQPSSLKPADFTPEALRSSGIR